MSDFQIPKINPSTFWENNPGNSQADNNPIAKEPSDSNQQRTERLTNVQKNKKFFSGKRKKIILIASSILAVLLIISVICGLYFYSLYKQALVLKKTSEQLIAAGKEQNLEKIKTEIGNTKTSLNNFSKSYKPLAGFGFVPYFGVYIKDGERLIKIANEGLDLGLILTDTIEPYADIIGFTSDSKEAQSGQETAQDRLEFVISTIPDLVAKSDEITAKFESIKNEVDKIDPDKYPEEFRGKKIRSMIKSGKDSFDTIATYIITGKPLLESANYLIGADETRNYLVLFQNDKELRPTGGFLTAYTIAKVQKGKFEPVYSDDIYNLDGKYTPTIQAPDPIIKYIKGPYILSRKLRLRDMNWSPDFSESMETIMNEVKKVGVSNVDGIIAVDTQLLVNILEVLGPIGVPGYGDYSTKIVPQCNCPQVIYELESFADIEGPIVWSENTGEIVLAPPNMDNRKKIIGPLMNSILANMLGQPKDKIPLLFNALLKSVSEKHVLLYMNDAKVQDAVTKFGIGGTIDEYDGDYLHINDSNLGGRKSNLYATQEVRQEINVKKDGSIEKILKITYKNPEKQDGWLNSVLPNWVRIYVPVGSELISFDGVEEKVDPYEDLGKTVFAGFFKLRPQGVAQLEIRYKIPNKFKDQYKLFIQKQPGSDAPLYTIKIGKTEEEIVLRSDKKLQYKI